MAVASAPSAPPAPSAPAARGKPFPDRLLRGVALVFLSLFHLQLKIAAGLVRFAIAGLRKAPGRARRQPGAGPK